MYFQDDCILTELEKNFGPLIWTGIAWLEQPTQYCKDWITHNVEGKHHSLGCLLKKTEFPVSVVPC